MKILTELVWTSGQRNYDFIYIKKNFKKTRHRQVKQEISEQSINV